MTKAACGLILFGVCATAQTVTVHLIVEGNAPIVELEFHTATGAQRTARFVVDTGGGAFILGSKLMADIGAKPMGPASKEDGETFVPLRPMTAKLGGMALDLSGVQALGTPDSKWPTMPANRGRGRRQDLRIPAGHWRQFHHDQPSHVGFLGEGESGLAERCGSGGFRQYVRWKDGK